MWSRLLQEAFEDMGFSDSDNLFTDFALSFCDVRWNLVPAM